MCFPKRHVVFASSVLLLLVVIVSALAGCGSDKKTTTPAPKLPDDPQPVKVVKGQATTLDLAGGAYLIIPPGTMDPGTTVRATYKGLPNGNWVNIAPTFAPVELITDPPNAIHGVLQLEFPIPTEKIIAGVDPAVQFGISTYDETTKTWTPVTTTYDADRHMVIALIKHFSWWNPFTWDWGALARAVQQGISQLRHERASPPHCSGAHPSWVSTINFLTVQNDAPILACAQTSAQWPGVLEIRMVNNRPYGEVLTYGSGVKWGWHESGSGEGRARNTFMDLIMGKNQLYLPPLSSATVGILEPTPGADVTFTIAPTWQSVGADFAFYALGQAQDGAIEKGFDKVIKGGVGACYAIGPQTALTDVSIASIHDYVSRIANCIEEAFSFDVAAGIMNDVQVGQLKSWYGAIKTAKVLAKGLLVADVVWEVGNFVSDAFLRDMPRGNGFEVQTMNGSTGSNPPPPPPSGPPPGSNPPPPTPPTPTPVPPPPPQQTWAETAGGVAHTWTNYQNAGGYQGQSVAQYQTIQIACKITGFVVADGNPWWYRIAQSPWNNTYYVSADAFYNNGATSGSLRGTPWVDPAVPNC